MMSLPSWLLKRFCRHSHLIMRRRGEHMGLECTSCFHWRPTQSAIGKRAPITPEKLLHRKVRPLGASLWPVSDDSVSQDRSDVGCDLTIRKSVECRPVGSILYSLVGGSASAH